MTGEEKSRLKRDGVLFLGLVIVHEALKYALAAGMFGGTLFSPGILHALPTLIATMLLVVVRVVLFVGVPGVLAAAAASAAVTLVSRVLSR